jgi:hypothetical protein
MAGSVLGTRITSAMWTTRNSTIAAMPRKWTRRAVSKPPNSHASSCNCPGFQMARPESTIRMPAAMTPR